MKVLIPFIRPAMIGLAGICIGFFIGFHQGVTCITSFDPSKIPVSNDLKHIDTNNLSKSEKVALIKNVVLDKIDFTNEPLLECLKSISNTCSKTIGMGFSFTSKGIWNPKITFRAEKIRVAETLHYIETLGDVTIALNEDGCLVTKNQNGTIQTGSGND